MREGYIDKKDKYSVYSDKESHIVGNDELDYIKGYLSIYRKCCFLEISCNQYMM